MGFCGSAAATAYVRQFGWLNSSLTALLLPIVAALALVPPASAAPFTGAELVKPIEGIGKSAAGAVSQVEDAAVKGDTLYYLAGCKEPGIGLWRSDGTRRGTTRLKLLDGRPHRYTYDCWDTPQIINSEGTLYILVQRVGESLDVWTSDGTAASTKLVKSLTPNDIEGPELLTAADGSIYFSMHTADHGWELWTSDGTASGTGMVKDIIPGPTGALGGRHNLEDRKFIFEDGHLYFMASPTAADDEIGDVALFRTDGTAAGTEQLTPDADDRGGLAELDGRIYFWRQDLADGSLELHAYEDGNLTEIADIVGDGVLMLPTAIWSEAGRIFVLATDSTFFIYDNTTELWVSDGIPGGDTSFVKALPSTGPIPNTTVELGGVSIFALDVTPEVDGDGYGLWRSDGTAKGTFQLGDVQVDPFHAENCNSCAKWDHPGGYDGWITKSGGYVYFAGWDFDHGWELWRTDGTSRGTALAVDINRDRTGGAGTTRANGPTADSDPRWLSDLGGRLLFTAADRNAPGPKSRALWRANHGNGVRVDGGRRGKHSGALNLALRVPRRPVSPTRMPAWLACKGGNCEAAVVAKAIIRLRTGRGSRRGTRTLKINLRPMQLRLVAGKARGVRLRFKKHKRVAQALTRLLRNRRRASGVVIVAARARSRVGNDHARAKMKLGPG